ncbi:MAG: spoIIIJ-associated protein [Patescibacteria group bacterium]|nr:spoIIIJ-associated protein [Patescibacteria group bacterium]
MQEQIEQISLRFFTLMGIGVESVSVDPEEEKRRIYRVTVKTPDSKMLIGMHGQTLESVRHLLTRLVERTVGKSFLIHLEVNDYLQAKDERLFRRIEERIGSLMRTGGEITLPELSSYERKKVHAYVADKKVEGLSTRSTGEGDTRMLHLSYVGTLEKAKVAEPSHERVSAAISDLSEDGIGI